MDFDGSHRVAASAGAGWDVVPDANRVAQWLPAVAVAPDVHDGTAAELEGDSHGLPCGLTTPWDATWRECTLEWGNSDGYRGSLHVSDEPSVSSEVRVNVRVPQEKVASFPGAEAEIRRGMKEALDRLPALVAQ